jgi:hypothetical protein
MFKAGNAQKHEVRLIKPWLYKGALILLAVAVLGIVIFPYAIPSLIGRLKASPIVSLSAPPLKPSISGGPIMGTPAQLVKDLKDIGFDLANAKFTKPELLKKSTTEAFENGHDYYFKNGSLSLSDDSKELDLIHLEVHPSNPENDPLIKAGNKTPLHLGSLSALFGNDKKAVLNRYGDMYAQVRNRSSFKYVKYGVLVVNSELQLWTIYLNLDSTSNVSEILAYKESENLYRVHLTKDKGGYKLSGTGAALYNDLMECGLSLGIPCTKAQILLRARTRRLASVGAAYYYANAIVVADDKSSVITSFDIQENGALGNAIKSVQGFAHGEMTFNGGNLISTFRRGHKAVQLRYGDEYARQHSDITDLYPSFNIILDDGTSSQHVDVTFDFSEAMDSGIFGHADNNPLFIISQNAPNAKHE